MPVAAPRTMLNPNKIRSQYIRKVSQREKNKQ